MEWPSTIKKFADLAKNVALEAIEVAQNHNILVAVIIIIVSDTFHNLNTKKIIIVKIIREKFGLI